jgi:hypothetical protein
MAENATINVSSENQSGGITAGIVNLIQEQEITLSEQDKNNLGDMLGDKYNKIYVSLQSGGSSNLTAFAQSIINFLHNEGFNNLQGVNEIMGFGAFKGVVVEKKPDNIFVIFIGALQ